MAVIEETVRTRLVGSTTVTGLVGNRIYPLKAPQQPTTPYIVYQRVSDVRWPTLEHTPATVAEARVQVKVYASAYTGTTAITGCRTVAEAIRKRLDGSTSTGTPEMQAASLISALDYYEDEARAYVTVQDFSVWHAEAT